MLIAVGLVAIIATMLITHPFSHQFEPGRLSLTFLDVGQGDAIVVTFPRGRLMLIDSGGDPVFRRESEDGSEAPFIEDRLGIAEAAVLPYLWSRGIDKLDWVVASHGDNDHIGGFSEVARSIRIGEKFAAVMRNASVPLLRPEPGECREIDGVIVGVLAGGGADNNGSLVIRLTFGRRSFLLTGDIEKEAERALVASGGGLRADVLKVAHHGSATSSTPEFLDSTQAELAVISAGRNNPFGHPSALVTERLLARGMTVCETARDGAITISTDGTDLKKSTGADGH
ncbi:MAG: MBL fold metallo-hydrolase [Acidobacteria bacterium]|nr:MBL fold metallo-hydrolase [Acidobacteriota bacterium]